ncbi:MAG: hypothetical protein N2B03_07685, partial [Boseongicola sp.]
TAKARSASEIPTATTLTHPRGEGTLEQGGAAATPSHSNRGRVRSPWTRVRPQAETGRYKN